MTVNDYMIFKNNDNASNKEKVFLKDQGNRTNTNTSFYTYTSKGCITEITPINLKDSNNLNVRRKFKIHIFDPPS